MYIRSNKTLKGNQCRFRVNCNGFGTVSRSGESAPIIES